MIRGLLTFFTLASTILFPWPFTVFLALISTPFEPLVPLAAGLFADTLYFSSPATLPVFTLCGALATALAFFVRSQLKTGIIGR
jgi:hypothetical protein